MQTYMAILESKMFSFMAAIINKNQESLEYSL